MARFYILRHGETEWNSDNNRYCGISDIPLSKIGLDQARLAAETLKNIDFSAAYSSPLKRAKETVSIIAKVHSIPPKTDSRISEIDFGSWEGKTREQILIESKDNWNSWLNDPTNIQAGEYGETANQVFIRSTEFFLEKGREYKNKNVLVVGHNTIHRLFIAGSLEIPYKNYRKLHQHNTGISIVEVIDDHFNWIQMNSTMHLL